MLPRDWGCLFFGITLVKSRADYMAAVPELRASAWGASMPTANLVLS